MSSKKITQSVKLMVKIMEKQKENLSKKDLTGTQKDNLLYYREAISSYNHYLNPKPNTKLLNPEESILSFLKFDVKNLLDMIRYSGLKYKIYAQVKEVEYAESLPLVHKIKYCLKLINYSESV